MTERVTSIKEMFPGYSEDKDGNPVIDPKELADHFNSLQDGNGGNAFFTPEAAKDYMQWFAEQQGLKQPVFIERN